MVYLTNVNQYGYLWPEATLYYTNGMLSGGRFDYPGGQDAQRRYFELNRYFSSIWGQPYSASGSQLSWFTPDNGFVTLSAEYTGGRYLTSLTVGH